MKKGQIQTEEAKQRLREVRSKQVHPSLAARGLTYQDVQDALARGLRWCSGECKNFLDSSLFSPAASCRKCKKCTAANSARSRAKRNPDQVAETNATLREWRKENAEHVRNEELARKYGVSTSWYDEQLAKQSGKCALCPATENTGNRKFFNVDHDHATGAIRELLCNPCNYFLGFLEKRGQIRRFDDGLPDVEWGQRATEYLLRHRP